MPINVAARSQKVSRVTVWKLKRNFEIDGEYALIDHKKGRPFEPLNSKFYEFIVGKWKQNKCGARKLKAIMDKQGFSVSLRKISQVLIAEGLQKPNLKKQKPRKYKRYEWPIPNYMWHTDWHIIKNERLNGQNIIVFLDDCSRKIMSYCIGKMTTQNSLYALYKGIVKHNVIPYCLNSDRGTQFYPNKKNRDRKASHAFQISLEELGIVFIPSRKRHPQTNGKNEKWFDIFEKEFDDRFENLDDFINWYNHERLSEAVDYMTPDEAYKKRL